MRLMWERFEDAVATCLAEETGESGNAPAPRVAAAQLVLVFRLLASDDVLAYIRAQPKRKQSAAFTHWLDESIRVVGEGIADYAPRAEDAS
jgi:hypothetical protein